MSWSKIQRIVSRAAGEKRAPEQVSRRDVLVGLGLAGAFAVIAPTLLSPTQAAATIIRPGRIDSDFGDDDNFDDNDFANIKDGGAEVIQAHYRRRRRRRRWRHRRWRGYRRRRYCIWTRHGYICWR